LYDAECVAGDEWDQCSGYGGEVDVESSGHGDRRVEDGIKHRCVVHGYCESKCYWEE
jgi:hypothetical protein